MAEIRVLIVDDHAILRDGIRSLLERQEGIVVVGEASNGREALSQVSEFLPDIVLMDVAMPEMNGLEATQLIKSYYPQIKVLILTQHDNREYVLPLLQSGASGYVLKRSGGREVVAAIRQVFEQGAFLEGSVAQQVLQDYASGEEDVSRPWQEAPKDSIPYLTDREQEVLRLIVAGKSNKEVGLQLGISPKTVSVHRSNLMTKLEVNNTVELIHYVTKNKLFNFFDEADH